MLPYWRLLRPDNTVRKEENPSMRAFINHKIQTAEEKWKEIETLQKFIFLTSIFTVSLNFKTFKINLFKFIFLPF